MEAIHQLQHLGFSQYEAQAYVTLLRENPLNGYELAKASGIPRPNIYPVLQKLEETGAVMRISLPEGNRYTPVPVEELLEKLRRRYHQSLDAASEELKQITPPKKLEPVLNFTGYPELLDQARGLIQGTNEHLLLSVWPQEAVVLAEAVQKAAERGVQITTLCLRGCPSSCPACQGHVFRYALAPTDSARWLVLIADDKELLAGQIPAGASSSTAVRTRQQMLVQLSGSYIQNSIALACILTHWGDRIEQQADPQYLEMLNALRPLQSNSQESWLCRMKKALQINSDSSQAIQNPESF